jgi:acyl-coenzyme A thioesterase PaaI-like protein
MTEASGVKGLQDHYAPHTTCFGCGPANRKGLRIKSMVDGDRLVATWTPEEHHEAFPGVLNGGIIGTLLDCHSNWTAAWHLMNLRRADKPPVTVTADFHVTLRRPTPTDRSLRIMAWVVESADPKVVVDAQVESGEEVTATCRGTFVAVGEGHPASGRW